MASRVASLLNSTALVATPHRETFEAWRNPRERDRAHLECISRLPCIVCARWPVEAAHIRYGVPEIGKQPAGMGEKPSDRWTVPLCVGHHRQAKDSQHTTNEREWWHALNIDPIALAQALHTRSGDAEAMLDIVNSSRPAALAESIKLDPLVKI